jgi:hypothetical protein
VLLGIAFAAIAIAWLRRAPPDDRVATAKATIRYYVDEAYPLWRATHAGAVCPPHLNVFPTPAGGDVDPWGGAYVLTCTKWGYSGEPTIRVRSAGPDRVLGTQDDIDPRVTAAYRRELGRAIPLRRRTRML